MNWHRLSDSQQAGVRKALEKHVSENIPGFAVVEKTNSQVMRFFDSVLFFVPGFMTSFITTYYPKVYVPSLQRWNLNHTATISILAHEYVHLSDRKRLSLLFNLAYLSPQILAVFALLAPLSPWFLLCLLFLAPIPSPGRAWAEIRGYRMTVAVYYWLSAGKYNLDYVIEHFIGPNYYWMWPFKKYIRRRLELEYQRIKNNDLDPELLEIKKVLTDAGVICYDGNRR